MAGYIQLTDERALFHSALDSSVKLLLPDRCCHDNAALFSVSKTLLKESYDYSQYNNVFQCADFLSVEKKACHVLMDRCIYT